VGLDPRQIIDVRNLIKSLAGDHTIILSTHILPEVSMTCSRVAIINRGKVVATNTPEQLVAQLTGGNGYELEVQGSPTPLPGLLRQVPYVKTVDFIADDTLAENHHRLRLTVETGTDPGREIAAAIVEAGLGLYEMRRTRVSLEDVFLELTTEEKAVDSDAVAQAYERAQNVSADESSHESTPDEPTEDLP
jgi:ABC-2 type transport system ATP-binding protein